MKRTSLIMGMPITLEVADSWVQVNDLEEVLADFRQIDRQFSPFQDNSEVTLVNAGLPEQAWSPQMREIMILAETTRRLTGGYFNAWRGGRFDPCGIVKGWAIQRAEQILTSRGYANFYVEAGGDIQTRGYNAAGRPWRVGIRNPFNRHQIVKVLEITGAAIATSGTASRGQHIYNPHRPHRPITDIVSLTVVGPGILNADRYATAAFAMGRAGIQFINQLPDYDGYLIDANQQATFTAGIEQYAAA